MKSNLRAWTVAFGLSASAFSVFAQDTPRETSPPPVRNRQERNDRAPPPGPRNQNQDPNQDPNQNPNQDPNQSRDPRDQQNDSIDASSRDFADVTIESIPGTNKATIRVKKKDLAQLRKIIAQIDKASEGAEVGVEIVPLKFADAERLAALLTRIQDERLRVQEPSQLGGLSVNVYLPIAQPNAVLVLARKVEMTKVIKEVKDLDLNTSGKGGDEKQIVWLKRAPAAQIAAKLQQIYGLQNSDNQMTRHVEVVADERSNSLIITAGPEDFAQAKRLISILDKEDPNAAVTQLRIFKLNNAVAADLALLLQEAIVARAQTTATATSAATGTAGAAAQQQFRPQTALNGQNQAQGVTAGVQSGTRISFPVQDKNGKTIESGILEDITISSDERSNSLIVTAPEKTMELLAALIEHLDSMPSPSAELKVFVLINSDATAMLQTLQQVFLGSSQTNGGAFGGNAAQNRANLGDRNFVPLGATSQVSLVRPSFSIDARTNSIIASGSRNDLLSIESLIFRLDNDNAKQRKTIVYPLRNILADSAVNVINQFISQQAQGAVTTGLQNIAQGTAALGASAQIAQEVNIVGETESNKLIISASPRYFDTVMELIKDLDSRPPQVIVSCLIAQVNLSDGEDLGMELGVQSSALFDRSLVVGNELQPGFNFNSTSLLRSPTGAPASEIVHQGLSNLGLGRANPLSGIGGLVYTASSDNVNILLRALRQQQRVDILSRPQLMTAENRDARILVGQKVPRVTSINTTQTGNTQNQVEDVDVGISLAVNAKISPDGYVFMGVDPVVSSLSPGAGVTIGTDGNGAPITVPIIDTSEAHTIVAAMDGQTVVIGGLITRKKSTDERKVPWLGDIPYLGWAFKTRFRTDNRQELLIILTPHIVHGELEVQRIKDIESRRVHMIMRDVEEVHGDIGLTPDPRDAVKKHNRKADARKAAKRSNYIMSPTELEHLWPDDCPKTDRPAVPGGEMIQDVKEVPLAPPPKQAAIMLPSRKAAAQKDSAVAPAASWSNPEFDRARATAKPQQPPQKQAEPIKTSAMQIPADEPAVPVIRKNTAPAIKSIAAQQVSSTSDATIPPPPPAMRIPVTKIEISDPKDSGPRFEGITTSQKMTKPTLAAPRVNGAQYEKMEVIEDPETDKPVKGKVQ